MPVFRRAFGFVRGALALLGLVVSFAIAIPGIRDTILGASIRSPHDFNQPWAFRGSSRSVDLIPSQMGPWRPAPSLAGYATPRIDGLWRSGHGTHPMSGTSGWPGRLTARTMLKHTGARRAALR